MASIVAWICLTWALVAVTCTRAVVAGLLWWLDRLDRWFNPVTRERIRRHNEIVARFRADVEEYNGRK